MRKESRSTLTRLAGLVAAVATAGLALAAPGNAAVASDANAVNRIVAAAHAQAGATAVPGLLTSLKVGDELTDKKFLFTANGTLSFGLLINPSGSLVEVSVATAKVIFTTHTSGVGNVLRFQEDGNLVLRSASGKALWTTHTAGKHAAAFFIAGNGDLVAATSTGQIVYNSHSGIVGFGSTVIVVLISSDLHYGAIPQSDGNFVIYYEGKGKEHAIWSTHTGGHKKPLLVLQSDGNLVLRDSGVVVWTSNTPGHAKAQLAMQNDGNLVLRDAAGKAIWTSGTAGKK